MTLKRTTLRVPVLDIQTFCGSGIPDDWQKLTIKGFRDIRVVQGLSERDRVACFPIVGDSLKHESILNGDILIVKLTHNYVANKIGIWETPHGRTAKYAYKASDDTVTLHNNADWKQVWQADEIKLIGMVVRVERDFK